jgi:N6-adenosine-specific RNA methylase IME4
VAFVWIKENRQTPSLFWGLGYWTRSNAEICVLATKGSPKRLSASVHQVILSRIEQHSKKPDETRDRIVQLMGDVTRVELFARQAAPGWDVWGNEITCTPTLTTWQPCNPRREG